MKNEFKSNLQRLARGMLLVRSLETGGFCATAAGLISVGVVWTFSWFADIGTISLLPLGMMLIGGLAGAMWTMLRGVGFTQVARFIDSRYTLRQHLSTGAELLEQTPNNPNNDVAMCVYRKGLADIASLPARINFWTLSRRTAFALLLTIAMCGLLAIGVLGTQKGDVKLSEISAAKRAGLEKAYRDAANMKQNYQLREMLLSAAEAIKMTDENRFDQLKLQLRREGFEISTGQVSSKDTGPDGANKAKSRTDAPTNNSDTDEASSTDTTNENGEEFRVLVYDPGYSHDASAVADSQRQPGVQSIPLQSAWKDACQTANTNLQEGNVPAEYREIIRRFFGNNFH